VGTPIVRFGGADAGTAAEAAPASAAPAASPSADGGKDAAAGDDSTSGGATLVGYGAVASSSKRRPRKNAAGGAAAAAPAAASTAAPAQQASAPQAATTATGGAASAATTSDASAQGSAGNGSSTAAATGGRPLAKPPVRKLAKDQGIDLASVRATGAAGEVTRADLQAHIDGTAASAAGSGAQAAGAQAAGAATPAVASADREWQEPLKGVKRAMSNAMVASAFTSPHVTVGVDVDVTGMMDLVRRLKAERALGEDVRVSPLLIIAKAVTRAALRHPGMNARLDDEVITYRGYVNLGIAAATDRGLIVPNIKDADGMGLAELAREIGELVAVARTGRTTPAAQSGGTITITNVGVFGVDWGTPIINPGESAIVAAGRVVKKPWVVDDEIVPREVMTLAVSADHRVVDGEVVSRFLRDVADALEDPITLLF
jgi:pyruvate dehydrogenase E2 component (dihydrolipoamide acetyltransferase)